MIIYSELQKGLKLLRVLGAFLEDSSSFPSTQVAQLTNACDIGSSGSNALFWPRTENIFNCSYNHYFRILYLLRQAPHHSVPSPASRNFMGGGLN